MKKRILVVAAHADDEVLGAGGSIARHSDKGDEVAVMFMTNGVGARVEANEEDIAVRLRAMTRALEILGVEKFECFDFPDNSLDTVPLLELAQKVGEFCEEWGQPTIIYTHFGGDLNVDHQLVHRAVMTHFRPQPWCKVREIRCFEVMSSTGWYSSNPSLAFSPQMFVNISEYLDVKTKALDAYEVEMREWPHARSQDAVRNLARYRGSLAGVDAAEAFVIERKLEGFDSHPD